MPKVRMVRNIKRPSLQDVERHNFTHCPYAAWCPHCIRGRAKGRPHPHKRKKIRGEKGDPIITLDCMWMKDRDLPEEYNNPIIVMKDNTTQFKRAHVARAKGVTADAINLIMNDLK